MDCLLRYLVLFMLLFAAPAAYGQTVIYQDDFEGTVSGWSINNTDFDPDVTTAALIMRRPKHRAVSQFLQALHSL